MSIQPQSKSWLSWSPLKLTTYNICHRAPRSKRSYFIERLKAITEIIKQEQPDILALQEVRDKHTATKKCSIIAKLIRSLSPLGYELVIEPGNPSAECFYNVIAYSKKLALVASKRFWPSNTDVSRCNDSWGPGHPRVITMATFKKFKRRPQKGAVLAHPTPIKTLKIAISKKQETIDIGLCTQDTLARLWDFGIKKGYRFIHLPVSMSYTCRVIGYNSITRFPEVVPNNLCSKNLTIHFYRVKSCHLTRISQKDGARVTVVVPLPEYTYQTKIAMRVGDWKQVVKQDNTYSTPITVINTHLGLGKGLSHPFEKKFTCQVIADQITQLDKTGHCFVMGDFNTFSGTSEEVARVFSSRGVSLNELSKPPFKIGKQLHVAGTFIGYPSDPYVKKLPKRMMGVQLDHIYRVENATQIWLTSSHVNITTCDKELNNRVITSEQQLLSHKGKEIRSSYPSDHLPLCVKLSVAL